MSRGEGVRCILWVEKFFEVCVCMGVVSPGAHICARDILEPLQALAWDPNDKCSTVVTVVQSGGDKGMDQLEA